MKPAANGGLTGRADQALSGMVAQGGAGFRVRRTASAFSRPRRHAAKRVLPDKAPTWFHIARDLLGWIARSAPGSVAVVSGAALTLAAGETVALALALQAGRDDWAFSRPLASGALFAILALLAIQAGARSLMSDFGARVRIRAAFAHWRHGFVATSEPLEAAAAALTAADASVTALSASVVGLVWLMAILVLRPNGAAVLALVAAAGIAGSLASWTETRRSLSQRASELDAHRRVDGARSTRLQLEAIGADLAAEKLRRRRLSLEERRALKRISVRAASLRAAAFLAAAAAATYVAGRFSGASALPLGLYSITGVRLGVVAARGASAMRLAMTSSTVVCRDQRTPSKAEAEAGSTSDVGSPVRAWLDNVSLVGPRDAEPPHRLSMDILPGVVTALVGGVGSGVAETIDLLMGRRLLASGSLRLDGQQLSAEHVEAWRRQCARVPARMLMVNGTLEDNLRLSAPSATEAAMWAALSAVGLIGRVRAEGAGLKLKLGPSGLKLSDGDSRRLSLARALLRSPRLLIVEEGAEALSEADDEAFYAVLKALRERCTVVITVTTGRALAIADRAYVLEAGQVVESGSVDVLLREPRSCLARLWSQL